MLFVCFTFVLFYPVLSMLCHSFRFNIILVYSYISLLILWTYFDLLFINIPVFPFFLYYHLHYLPAFPPSPLQLPLVSLFLLRTKCLLLVRSQFRSLLVFPITELFFPTLYFLCYREEGEDTIFRSARNYEKTENPTITAESASSQ